MQFHDLTGRARRAMQDHGWMMSALDDTLRSRIARAVGDWRNWYDWGHPVMWLVGRYDTGSAGVPRGDRMPGHPRNPPHPRSDALTCYYRDLLGQSYA